MTKLDLGQQTGQQLVTTSLCFLSLDTLIPFGPLEANYDRKKWGFHLNTNHWPMKNSHFCKNCI